MKQRALPQSFWQQPNMANPQSPSKAFANLPTLSLDDCVDITPVEEVSCMHKSMEPPQASPSLRRMSSSVSSSSTSAATAGPAGQSGPDNKKVIISQANTDLLFSLFNSVEEEETQRRIHVVRRGR